MEREGGGAAPWMRRSARRRAAADITSGLGQPSTSQGRLEGVGAGGVVAGGQRGVQRLDLGCLGSQRHLRRRERAAQPLPLLLLRLEVAGQLLQLPGLLLQLPSQARKPGL